MDVHILNGNAFGGVESLFFNLAINNKLDHHNEHIFFLENLPEKYSGVKEVEKFIISKSDLLNKKYPKIRFFAHSDYKGVFWLTFFKFFLKSEITAVSHGVLLSSTKNYLIKYILQIIKFYFNHFIFNNKVAISKISGDDYFIGNYKILSYTPSKFPMAKSFKRSKIEDLKILCIGRFYHSKLILSAKNQNYIFKILKELDRRKINIEMTFIGSGKSFYDILCNKYVFSKRIKLKYISTVNDDISEIKKNNLILSPSIHESYGQVLLWSQLVGVSCIASKNVCVEVDIGNIQYLPIENDSIKIWAQKIIDKIGTNFTYKDYDFDIKEYVYSIYIDKLRKIFK